LCVHFSPAAYQQRDSRPNVLVWSTDAVVIDFCRFRSFDCPLRPCVLA
jgi:hypothetical protein